MAIAKQIDLDFHKWGGARKGAGRKLNKGKRNVPHVVRPPLATRFPVHVTLRVRSHVFNLRSQRCFSALKQAFREGRDRFGFGLVHFSVQGNHIHLIVEAKGAQSLSKGMQGLTIRMARRLNLVMKRRGSVFADRYHAHILKSPREVRNAVAYVLGNHKHHAMQQGRVLNINFVDKFCSATAAADLTLAPRTWLLIQTCRHLRL